MASLEQDDAGPREAGVGDALKVLQVTYLAYASGCLPLIGW